MPRGFALLPLLSLALIAQAPKAQPAKDQAIYVDRALNAREKAENETRDRFLAERSGKPYHQAEEALGKRLSLDFSKLDRPTGLAEFKQTWHFPPKRQWWTNTCWSFSTTSFLESEVKRLHGKEIKLSEMFPVYWEFVSKAKGFVRTKGKSFFGEGSESEAVLIQWKEHGIVRQSDYPGLLPGQTEFNHELMFEELKAYLDHVKRGDYWDEVSVVTGVRAILDKHMGRPPEKITVEGRELTPRQFHQEIVKLQPEDYIALMSFRYAPFWAKGEYNVEDNWWHSREYLNLPLEAWYDALKGAITKGYSVAIGGDVSEVGYDGEQDVAIVPTFDVPQDAIDQDSREFRFSNRTSTDDHAIHVVGYARRGNRDWFLIKDSARSAQRGIPGYYFYRDDYVRLKMLTFMVHKDAVKDLLPRFK